MSEVETTAQKFATFLRNAMAQEVSASTTGAARVACYQGLRRVRLLLDGKFRGMVYGAIIDGAHREHLERELGNEVNLRLARLTVELQNELRSLLGLRPAFGPGLDGFGLLVPVPPPSPDSIAAGRFARSLPLEVLAPLVADPAPELRAAAVRGIGQGTDADSRPRALAILEPLIVTEEDPDTLAALGEALLTVGDSEVRSRAARSFASRLTGARDELSLRRRESVIAAMVALEPLRVTQLFSSPDPHDALSALRSFSASQGPLPPEVAEALMTGLAHANPSVVAVTAVALGVRGVQTALPRLRPLLNADRPREVRAGAFEAICRLGTTTPAVALPTLVAIAADEHEAIRPEALRWVEWYASQATLSQPQVEALTDGLPRLPAGSPAEKAVNRLRVRRRVPSFATKNGNPELEAAIDASPDDPRPWLVYADWLQARGDALGEVIALAHAGKAFLPLVRERGLFGPLGEVTDLDALQDWHLEWFMGFVRSATVRRGANDAMLSVVLAHLLATPITRFIQELRLGPALQPEELTWTPSVEILGASGRGATLRRLTLGEFDYPDDVQISDVAWGDLSSLWQVAPRLERLHLRGSGGELGEVNAPALRELVIETGGLARATLEAVLEMRAPLLTRLELWFGDPAYGAECDEDDLAALLDGSRFPALTHLGLCNCEFAEELIVPLSRSPLLRRLESLDLSKSALGDEGIALLAQHRDAFAHLRSIDLRACCAGDDAANVLEGLPVDLSEQRDGERYVAVGE